VGALLCTYPILPYYVIRIGPAHAGAAHLQQIVIEQRLLYDSVGSAEGSLAACNEDCGRDSGQRRQQHGACDHLS